MNHSIWLWVVFNLFVVVMLVLDLFVFHRKAHHVKIREALLWTLFWMGLALVFCAGVYHFRGADMALKFLTGYVLEESLSVDNLFVFLLIFNYFRLPAAYQHRVLFWGIVGALIMRAVFILTGISLIHRFGWILYLFGGFLIVTGIKLVFSPEKEVEPEKNIVLKLLRRLMPVTQNYEGQNFFVKKDSRWFATPLFVVLLMIETTDVIFALDSIPAILAVTTDSFIVYTSNIFAILGLRSLFFALSGLMQLFYYLRYGLGFILAFIGFKMLIAKWIHVPISVTLGMIVGVLAVSILGSLVFPPSEHKKNT